MTLEQNRTELEKKNVKREKNRTTLEQNRTALERKNVKGEKNRMAILVLK